MSGFARLSRAEMKNVLGGLLPGGGGGSACAAGQSLYSCVQEGACATTGGVVCATGLNDAAIRVINTLASQGTYGPDCWNVISCGPAD